MPMEIDIEEFDQVNHGHLRDANNLLDIIIDDNGYEFDVVLDLGCGSGRGTSLIDCRLRCNRIVAIDMDMKAIKYANKNFAAPRIQYKEEDFSLSWEKLDPEIQKLAGKVDLIISNRVLHWIENKNEAIKNLYRLLKTGGKVYANVTTLWDLFADLSEEERKKYNTIVAIPSEEDQQDLFQQLFSKNGFKNVQVESSHLRQVYPEEEFKTVILPYFPNLTKRYLTEKDLMKRNKIMASGLRKLVIDTFLKHYCRQVKGEDRNHPVEYELTYGQIRIVAQK